MQHLYDVIVIGGGPSGLTAALYLARAKYRVLVLEKDEIGGQIRITQEVVNYPGIEMTDGHKLTQTMRKQAENFGAEFMMADAQKLELSGDIKKVYTDKGELEAFGIVIATGASPRMLGFEGESKFKGRGVAYCATCDGEFFTGKEVFVIGGGFAAAEEGVFLTRYAKHVNILIRKDDFSCAKSVADHAKNHEKITIYPNTEVVEASGEDFLTKFVYKNNKTGEITTYEAEDGDTFGIFVFAGYTPQVSLVKDQVKLTDRGYIWTDSNQKTSIDGVYAAGDVCEKVLRQVVTAVGDGAIAATELEKHVQSMHKKTGIVPEVKSVKKVEPIKSEKVHTANVISDSALFTSDIIEQLNAVFDRMENKLVLELCLDDRAVSKELEAYINEMANLTDKLSVKINNTDKEFAPCVRILKEDLTYTGMAFHGVPGGHEFNSFILGLYNIAGPGQAIDESIKTRIQSIDKKVNIKILVSLSCTMCPDLVVAAWKIGSLNDNISVETFDINHFGDLKDKYKVMSVPCMVIDDKVTFGKKNIEQILDLI